MELLLVAFGHAWQEEHTEEFEANRRAAEEAARTTDEAACVAATAAHLKDTKKSQKAIHKANSRA